jgi:cbb3-type cytochrome oxidase subunit 3
MASSIVTAVAGVCARWRLQSIVSVAALLLGVLYCGVTFAFWSATRQAVDQTRNQILLTQRPWITVPRIELSEPLAANHPVRVTASVKNTGLSPALDVVTTSMLAVRQTQPGFVGRLVGRGDRRTDMGASDVQLIYMDLDQGQLREDDLAALQSGRQNLYAIVEVIYSDPFGHSGATSVCASYRPAQRDFGPCATGSELR